MTVQRLVSFHSQFLDQPIDDKLLKIKVLQKVLHSDAIEEPFLVPQRSIQVKVL